MGWKRKYLSIAVAMTALDLLVAFRYGVAVWRAYADFLMVRLLLLLFVAIWMTSLADLWSRAVGRSEQTPIYPRMRFSDIPASTAADAEARDV